MILCIGTSFNRTLFAHWKANQHWRQQSQPQLFDAEKKELIPFLLVITAVALVLYPAVWVVVQNKECSITSTLLFSLWLSPPVWISLLSELLLPWCFSAGHRLTRHNQNVSVHLHYWEWCFAVDDDGGLSLDDDGSLDLDLDLEEDESLAAVACMLADCDNLLENDSDYGSEEQVLTVSFLMCDNLPVSRTNFLTMQTLQSIPSLWFQVLGPLSRSSISHTCNFFL